MLWYVVIIYLSNPIHTLYNIDDVKSQLLGLADLSHSCRADMYLLTDKPPCVLCIYYSSKKKLPQVCVRVVGHSKKTGYVVILVIIMQLQTNFGTAQSHFTVHTHTHGDCVTCGIVSDTGSRSFKSVWAELARGEVGIKAICERNVLHRALVAAACWLSS